jgi:hypothetical protein
MEPNPVLKKLGFSTTDRLAIIHADDVGMCQASVSAFADLQAYGLVSCGAAMVPCGWFPEAARYSRQHPEADLGVHLTLTSEWDSYRWGPLSTRDPATGLLDPEGYFHRRSQEVQEQADPQAVAGEIEAQIQRAKAAGIPISHIDTHMGTVAHPKFMQSYLQAALAHRVAPMMLRMDEPQWRRFAQEHRTGLDEGAIQFLVRTIHTLEEMNVPLLDHLTGLPLDSDPELRLEHAKAAFDQLPAGVTHFIIHPSQDTPELRGITPDWACRAADWQTFQTDALRQHLRQTGIHVIGYRALQQLM